MLSPMRWSPLRCPPVWHHAGLQAGAATATNARLADTPVRTGTPRPLETLAGVVVFVVIPVAAWTVASVAIGAARLRSLLAAPPCP